MTRSCARPSKRPTSRPTGCSCSGRASRIRSARRSCSTPRRCAASSAPAWRACTRRSAWQPSARARRASRSASSRPTARTPTWPSWPQIVAARKLAGAEMLRNTLDPCVPRRPPASSPLVEVDTRLLVTLVTLAHSHPVDIISFGTSQAGASPGVPLRSAEIAGAPGPGSTPAASVQTLRSFLSAQQTALSSISHRRGENRITANRASCRVSGAQPAWPARHARLRQGETR